MKTKLIILTPVFLFALFFSGCITETIDTFSTFNFQLMIPFHSTHYDKASPDTSVDFTNLNKYKEYRDNKDRIKKALILQANYWIDSLVYKDNQGQTFIFDPKNTNQPKVEFEFVKFFLRFAERKPFPVNGDEFDPVNYQYSTSNPTSYLLGEFRNVDVGEYFRRADHIINVDDEVARIISEAVKNNPTFYIITEYSIVKGQTIPKREFPFIAARYDLDIRFEIEL